MMVTGFQRSDRSFRRTFADMLEEERITAAQNTWAKALAVSSLRRCVSAPGKHRQARMLGEMKVSLVKRSLELAPERVTVAIDDDYHIGLLSVRWPGRGRLHLPAATELNSVMHQAPPLAMVG